MSSIATNRPRSLLDGFFTADVDAVALALNALDDVLSLDADRSHGRVRSGSTFHGQGRPVRGGLFCERIFGPLRKLICACGRVNGPAREGEVCESCGVLCADPELRAWRWGHVEVPIVIHPLLYPTIADVLGISASDVAAIVRCEATFIDGVVAVPAPDPEDEGFVPAGHGDTSGPEAIERALLALLASEASRASPALVRAALVKKVPVPPPGDRPLIENLVPGQKLPWTGPLCDDWGAFIQRAERSARYLELDAPPILLALEARLRQLRLEDVVMHTVRPEPLLPLEPWSRSGRRRGEDHDGRPPHVERIAVGRPLLHAPPLEDEAARQSVAVVFVDGERIAWSDRDEVVVVHVRDGRELTRFPAPRRRLQCAQEARYLVFDEWLHDDAFFAAAGDVEPAVVDDQQLTAHRALYDLVEGRYLTSWPAHLPEFSSQKGEPEDVFLVDLTADAQLACPWGGNDRPELLAWSSDGRYAWMGSEHDGGVLDVVTGLPMIEARVDDDDGRTQLGDGGDESASDEEPVERTRGVYAVGLTHDDEWRFVHDDGTLSDGARVLARLGIVDAAAIAPGGEHIATVLRGVLTVRDARGSPLREIRR